jgi:hypothetical protein
MNVFKTRRERKTVANGSGASTAVPSASNSVEMEGRGTTGYKADGNNDAKAEAGKMPHVTLRTILMAALVAMGGFIFGMIYNNE